MIRKVKKGKTQQTQNSKRPSRQSVKRLRKLIPDLANVDMSEASITPIELLAILLGAVLKGRITDKEIGQICTTYYKTVKEWWAD
jgi:hypothetical protein